MAERWTRELAGVGGSRVGGLGGWLVAGEPTDDELFATGVVQLLAETRSGRRPEVWAAAIGGVLSIALGFLIASSLPSSAAWAIGLLVGINLMFWGVRALIGSHLLTSMEPRR